MAGAATTTLALAEPFIASDAAVGFSYFFPKEKGLGPRGYERETSLKLQFSLLNPNPNKKMNLFLLKPKETKALFFLLGSRRNPTAHKNQKHTGCVLQKGKTMPLPNPQGLLSAFVFTATEGKSMTPRIPVHSEAFFLLLRGFFLSLRAQRSNLMIIRATKRLLRRASSQ